MLAEEELLHQAAGGGAAAERMGLTPDWIISTAAFKVFQLQVGAAADVPVLCTSCRTARSQNWMLSGTLPVQLYADALQGGSVQLHGQGLQERNEPWVVLCM